MSGSQRSRCSSVPNAASGKQDRACTQTPTATLDHARGELLEHLQVDLVRLPAAAVLLGIGQAEQPGRPSVRKTSRGNRSSASSCATRGASSRSTRVRTSRRRSASSEVRTSGEPGMRNLST